MPIAKYNPANRMLSALPRQNRKRLLARFDQVELVHGDVLGEPGKPLRYVYFPNSGIVSLLTPVSGHASVETGLVGNEGMAGIALFLGMGVSPMRMVVQDAGTALRMEAVAFCHEIAHNPVLQRRLNRYVYGLIAQVAQTAACNRFHQIEARLARRLLMTQDRTTLNEVKLTHESLAHMLGVRRAGITLAATLFQKKGLIRYSRGNIVILDRTGLEREACECYQAVNAICRHVSV